MTTNQKSKVVTRWEVWCEDCSWTDECVDPIDAREARIAHEKVCVHRTQERSA